MLACTPVKGEVLPLDLELLLNGQQPALSYNSTVSVASNNYSLSVLCSYTKHTVGLLSNTSTIMATMNDSTIVLYCEMRAFIRQDSSLIWEGPSRQRIRGGMGKYLITFSNGLPNTSANGGGVLVPSRVSTLTIINPELSDAGTYTCSVMGTNQAVMIDLQVNSSDKRETTDTVTDINTTGGTQASSTTSLSGDNGTLQLAGIVVGSMAAILTGLLVITAAAVCCLVYKRKFYNKTEKIPNTDPDPGSNIYDYITLPRLDHGVQHRNDQPEETTATKWDDSITYDVIKDDNTVEKNRVYDEINYDLSTRKSDDACNINTIEVNGVAIDSEVNGDYEVPIDILEKNKAYGVSTDGIDTTEGTMAYGAR